MDRVRNVVFVALGTCAVLAGCGADSRSAVAPVNTKVEYGRCREIERETSVGEARACWVLFLRKYGDVASDAERDAAQASIDRATGTRSEASSDALSQGARQGGAEMDALPRDGVPGPGPSRSPSTRVGPTACYQGFRTTANPEADLRLLTSRCGEPTGLSPMTAVKRDEIAAGKLDVYRINLMEGECYRFFAVGAPTLSRLDAALFSPDATRVAADQSGDRAPIVGPRAPFCPKKSGEYRYVLYAAQGGGTYYYQVFRASRSALEQGPGSSPPPANTNQNTW